MGTTMVVMWSTLPEELLREIAQKLGMLMDFVNFRAVCKAWRFAVKPSDLPPQLPWLILHSGHLNVYTFYDMGTGNVLALSLPGLHFKHFLSCSSDGWLIQGDSKSRYSHILSLRHPLTRSHISLPPLKFRGRVAGARLSCNPASSSACGRCIVLVWIDHCNTRTLLSSQLKTDGQWSDWSTVPTLQHSDTGHVSYVKDLVVTRDHENLYGIDNVNIFHVGLKKNTLRMIPRPEKTPSIVWNFSSLVELSSGELLLAVVFFFSGKAGGPDTLEVYRLENARWMKIEGSGIYQDQAIFLSPGQSFSVSARGHWSAGHAYLATKGSITVFSLKDGSCTGKQPMYQPEGRFRSTNSWFVPSLCP